MVKKVMAERGRSEAQRSKKQERLEEFREIHETEGKGRKKATWIRAGEERKGKRCVYSFENER